MPAQANAASSSLLPSPQQQQTPAGAKAAVLRASTSALWEQLYGASTLSLSVERLMYRRLMKDQGDQCTTEKTAAVGTAPAEEGSATSWTAHLFAPHRPFIVSASSLVGSHVHRHHDHRAATTVELTVVSRPPPVPAESIQRNADEEEKGTETAETTASSATQRRMFARLSPSSYLPPTSDDAEKRVGAQVADAAARATASPSPSHTTPVKSPLHGSVVLRPSTRESRSQTAPAESLNPGFVSSPPERALHASMSALVSPLMPPPRDDVSHQEASTLSSSTMNTTVTLVAETSVGQGLVGSPAACEIKNEEEEEVAAASAEPLRTPVRHVANELKAAQVNEEEEEEEEGVSNNRSSSPTRRETNGTACEEVDGFVSLHASPAPQPSPGPTVDLADTLTAIPRGTPTPFPHYAAEDTSARAAVAAEVSLSPVVDREGLVFSPSRRRQALHLRLQQGRRQQQRPPQQQRRRQREPSEDNVSSTGSSPLSSPAAPAFVLSRSPFATPTLDALEAEEDVEETMVCSNVQRVPFEQEEEEEKGRQELSGGASAASANNTALLLPIASPSCTLALPQPLVEEVMKPPEKSNVVAEPVLVSPTPLQPSLAQNSQSASEGEEEEEWVDVCVAVPSIPTTPKREAGVEDARVEEEEEGDEGDGDDEALDNAATSVEEPRSSVVPLGGSPVDVRHTIAAGATSPQQPELLPRSPSTREGAGEEAKVTAHRSPSPSYLSPSRSPAPRCVSPPFTACSSPPPTAAEEETVLHTRPSVSTMDFTWAAEADEALRRQQERLHSHSLAQRSCSPGALGGGGGTRPPPHVTNVRKSSSASAEQQKHSPSLEGRGRGAVGFASWSASPQPLDPVARLCAASMEAATADTTTTTRTPCYAASQSRVQKAPPSAAVGGGFASPKCLASSLSPHRSCSPSASPLPPPPPPPALQRRAGEKRPREPTGCGSGGSGVDTSIYGSVTAPQSPSPTVDAVAGNVRRRRKQQGDQRTNKAAAAAAVPQHHFVVDGAAAMRRCRARLNAPGTATAASNEFVLPRTASLEPTPPPPPSATPAARAASLLQLRPANHAQPHGEYLTSLPSSFAKAQRTMPFTAPRTSAAASRKRRGKTTATTAAAAVAAVGGGDVNVCAGVPHRKPSLVTLNDCPRQARKET